MPGDGGEFHLSVSRVVNRKRVDEFENSVELEKYVEFEKTVEYEFQFDKF